MNKLLESAAVISRQVSIKSIFNSLLWILPLPILAVLFLSFTPGAKIVLYFFMVIVALVVLVVVTFFIIILTLGLRGKPELFKLLRSEGHIEKMATIEKLGDQKSIFLDTANSEDETNPGQPNPSTILIPNPKDIPQIKAINHE